MSPTLHCCWDGLNGISAAVSGAACPVANVGWNWAAQRPWLQSFGAGWWPGSVCWSRWAESCGRCGQRCACVASAAAVEYVWLSSVQSFCRGCLADKRQQRAEGDAPALTDGPCKYWLTPIGCRLFGCSVMTMAWVGTHDRIVMAFRQTQVQVQLQSQVGLGSGWGPAGSGGSVGRHEHGHQRRCLQLTDAQRHKS